MNINPFHKTPLKGIFALALVSVVSMQLLACSAYSPKNTVYVIAYNPPRIESIAINEAEMGITVGINLNPQENSDFKEYWLLMTAANNNSQCAKSDFSISSDSLLTNRADFFPEYFAEYTATNSFSGTKVNDTSLNLPIIDMANDGNANLWAGTNTEGQLAVARGSDLCAAVVAWGSNEDYAEIYENNGWLVSDISAPQNFYIGSSSRELLMDASLGSTGNIGYSINSSADPFQEEKVHTHADIYLEDDTHLGLVINVSDSVQGIGILPIGSGTSDLFKSFVVDESISFLTRADISDGYPLFVDAVFIVKHANNYLSKFWVKGIEEGDSSVTIDVVYTLDANVKNF